MSVPPVARVLVLSEDDARDAVPTVQALLRHMMRQVEPEANLDRVALDPLPDSLASTVVAGNVWKSAKGTANAGIVDLVQRLARHLVLADGFVVHHVDGDRVWAERATSENVAKYQAVIVRRVREQVRVWTAKQKRGVEVDARMGRLLVLMPFWCIEAWLFQNGVEARRRCPDPMHECRPRLDAWSAAPDLLDEEQTTKERLCFKSRHNLALASDAFPAESVAAIGKSYAAAIEALRACAPLVEALRRATEEEAARSVTTPEEPT